MATKGKPGCPPWAGPASASKEERRGRRLLLASQTLCPQGPGAWQRSPSLCQEPRTEGNSISLPLLGTESPNNTGICCLLSPTASSRAGLHLLTRHPHGRACPQRLAGTCAEAAASTESPLPGTPLRPRQGISRGLRSRALAVCVKPQNRRDPEGRNVEAPDSWRTEGHAL